MGLAAVPSLQLFSLTPYEAPTETRNTGTLNANTVYELPQVSGSYTVNAVEGSLSQRLDTSTYFDRQADGTLQRRPTSELQVPSTFLGVDFSKLDASPAERSKLLVGQSAPPADTPNTPDKFAAAVSRYAVSEANAATLVQDSTFFLPGVGLGYAVEQYGSGLSVKVDAQGNIQLVSDASGGISAVRPELSLRAVQEQTLRANDGLRVLDQVGISSGAVYGFAALNASEQAASQQQALLDLQTLKEAGVTLPAGLQGLDLEALNLEREALLKRLEKLGQSLGQQPLGGVGANTPQAVTGALAGDPFKVAGALENPAALQAGTKGPGLAGLGVQGAEQAALLQALPANTTQTISELTASAVLQQLKSQAVPTVQTSVPVDLSRSVDGRMPFSPYLPGAETGFNSTQSNTQQSQQLLTQLLEDAVNKRGPGLGAYSPAFAQGGGTGTQTGAGTGGQGGEFAGLGSGGTGQSGGEPMSEQEKRQKQRRLLPYLA
jgi:hypothetical protein